MAEPVSPEGLDHAFRMVPRYAWLAWGGSLGLLAGLLAWGWFGSVAVEAQGNGMLLSGSLRRLLAPADGTVEAGPRVGRSFRRGEVLLGIRAADGTLATLPASDDGVVVETYVEAGAVVQRGDPLANVEPQDYRLLASVFVPMRSGTRILPGMAAHVSLLGLGTMGEGGLLVGRVTAVSRFPASPQRLMALFENRTLAEGYLRQGPVYEVTIALDPDPAQPGGYRWASGRPPPLELASGMAVQAAVLLAERRPLALLLPWLGR